MPLNDLLREGERIMTICNACRYCEGYCAVFPAMERRTTFTPADLNYLANLCHDCGECFYACPYAPPHEFAVNVPKTLAQIRLQSYQHYATPGPLGRAFYRSGPLTFAILAACLAVAIFAFSAATSPDNSDFYAVIGHRTMVVAFGAAAMIILVALFAGLLRFWRESGDAKVSFDSLKTAIRDTLALRYLSSGGRRWFHHATFYGFALCFASTTFAAMYHYVLGWTAPYGYLSLPVILGAVGGIGLLIGPAGLYGLKKRRDPATSDAPHASLDTSFIVLLFLTSLTGLLLLAFRESAAMPPLLIVHLAIVMALFLTLPYGKFVHALYRFAALLRYASETKR